MSIYESCALLASGSQETTKIGHSLAHSLYRLPLTLLLTGELGAGKTVFTQGLARGLTITESVVSPTYAIEQRYGEAFLHIDLYRLSEQEAKTLLLSSEHFSGVRVIEWADKVPPGTVDADGVVEIAFSEHGEHQRSLGFTLKDFPLPTTQEMERWMEDVRLPAHIRRHAERVAQVALQCADALLARKTFVRREALMIAALLHDLCKFVDFTEGSKRAAPLPSEKEHARWEELRKTYAPPHERAAAQYVAKRGYSELGTLILTHGAPRNELPRPETTEQLLLNYADKRVTFDSIVSLDERFDEFIARYGEGVESAYAKEWREEMKGMERELFPEGPPV